MTIKKFRMIDLAILTIIAIVVDVVGYFASSGDLFAFYVMLSTPIVLIAYVRWKAPAIIMNFVLAVVHMLVYKIYDPGLLLGYSLGIMAISAAMLWFILIKPSNIRKNWIITILYFLTGYLAMFGVHVLTNVLLGEHVNWGSMFIRHGFNIALGIVVMIIAAVQKDLMVDMKENLLKQIKERQDEEN